MTRKVISVTEETSVHDIASILDSRHISGLPVVAHDGKLVGLVSDFDLISKPTARTAAQAMTANVISVNEETSIDDVRFLLVSRRIRRVPVVRGEHIVGIVSRADLIHDMSITWVCTACGHTERDTHPPADCPRCGVAAESFQAMGANQVGEGADVPTGTCAMCGQKLPDEALA
jgi:CBS-domain-containing membrane protein